MQTHWRMEVRITLGPVTTESQGRRMQRYYSDITEAIADLLAQVPPHAKAAYVHVTHKGSTATVAVSAEVAVERVREG